MFKQEIKEGNIENLCTSAHEKLYALGVFTGKKERKHKKAYFGIYSGFIQRPATISTCCLN
jgi:hypothetical protein